MRKYLLFIVFFCLCSFYAKAQLYVGNNGHTVVGDRYFSQGVFTVSTNTGQHQPQLAFIKSTESGCALEICNFTPFNMLSSSEDMVGVRIMTGAQAYRRNIGIQSRVTTAGSTPVNGFNVGVWTAAGYGTSGFNYGVNTYLMGNQNGAGILASSSDYYAEGLDVQGKWAGYFCGDVKVLGTLTATTLTQTSDYRLKDNICQLNDGYLDRLMDMNVVKYNLKNFEVTLGDSARTKRNAYEPDSPLLKVDHYGLIAQELAKLYPELVVEGSDGYLSVNYIELIPILIKSVQELKIKVDELESSSARASQKGSENTQTDQADFHAVLYQNNPNPFTENTTIQCLIPNNVSSAKLYIYDNNGHQIDSMVISERGNVFMTIEGNSMDAGIYLYSLITDGVVVDTKRLILTK